MYFVLQHFVDLYSRFLFKLDIHDSDSSDSRSCGTDNGVEICVLESLCNRG